MSDPNKMFVYPSDVDAFGFDWGLLALTVAPEVNGAARFSGGVVDLPSGQGHALTALGGGKDLDVQAHDSVSGVAMRKLTRSRLAPSNHFFGSQKTTCASTNRAPSGLASLVIFR